MKKRKFTPGPWLINGQTDERDGSVFCVEQHPMFAGLDYPRCITIAPYLEKSDQWEANARLIAAAPELLAALERLADMHTLEQEGIMPPTPEEWFAAVDQAAITIQKAKGEFNAV